MSSYFAELNLGFIRSPIYQMRVIKPYLAMGYPILAHRTVFFYVRTAIYLLY